MATEYPVFTPDTTPRRGGKRKTQNNAVSLPAPNPDEAPPVPSRQRKKDEKSSFSKVILDDVRAAYYDLGGKEMIVRHVRSHASYRQKFIEGALKLAGKQIDSDINVRFSGKIEQEHIYKFGFTPETVVAMMADIQSEGQIDLKAALALPVPEDPEGDSSVMDADFTEVK